MQERRNQARRRTYLGATFALDGQDSHTECLVRNVSENGAKLCLTNPARVPAEFRLAIAKTQKHYYARVVWRRLGEFGVTFVNNAG